MTEKPYHHGDLHNKLIEAGIELINEQGLNGFSLRKVAAKCNVSHAAPYSHFKDVDALIQAMGEHVTQLFTAKLRDSIAGQETNPHATEWLGRAYISFFIDNPQYFQFLFYHSGLVIDLDNDNADDYQPFALFRKTAYQMFRNIGLPEEAYTQKLIELWSMVHGAASLLTNPGIRYSGDWRNVFTNKVVFKEDKR